VRCEYPYHCPSTSGCQYSSALSPKATPIATNLSQHLPQSFFARPAEVVAPDLIGCLLVKRQPTGELLWGVIVETEAYCQSEPACHGHRRRSPSNETLFGEPGRFYVYVSYGIHHCVKSVKSSFTP
jgi:DNA-3-methyladenine glycosylase